MTIQNSQPMRSLIRLFKHTSHRRMLISSCHTGNQPIKTLEWPNIEEWNAILTRSQKLFGNPNDLMPKSDLSSSAATSSRAIIRRMRRQNDRSEHLIRIFQNLSENNNYSLTRWPGLVTLMFSRAVQEVMTEKKSQDSNNFVWQQQLALAGIINLLYSSFLFKTEFSNVEASYRKPSSSFGKHTCRLVNSYFISEALYRLRTIKNPQVVWLTAATMESLAKAGNLSHTNTRQHRTLDDWEDNVHNPQGTIVANGCKAAMELANFTPGLKELGFQYGRFLTLAAKAHTDIKQFIDYQRSSSSYFSLNSLPVVLHLQRNPETLAYIYSCKETLDNLDLHVIHSAISSSSSLEEAKQLLNNYVQTVLIILNEFQDSKLAKNLSKLTEALNKFE